jgi:hypothetical protein
MAHYNIENLLDLEHSHLVKLLQGSTKSLGTDSTSPPVKLLRFLNYNAEEGESDEDPRQNVDRGFGILDVYMDGRVKETARLAYNQLRPSSREAAAESIKRPISDVHTCEDDVQTRYLLFDSAHFVWEKLYCAHLLVIELGLPTAFAIRMLQPRWTVIPARHSPMARWPAKSGIISFDMTGYDHTSLSWIAAWLGRSALGAAKPHLSKSSDELSG